MTNLSSVENPGSHEHLPTTVDGQQVCMSCNQVLIQPLLTQEDFKAANTLSEAELWKKVVVELSGCPADFILLQLGHEVPYIKTLMDAFPGDPPHTRTLRWWND